MLSSLTASSRPAADGFPGGPIASTRTRSASPEICDIYDNPVNFSNHYITCAQMRMILLHRLPVELVDIILQWAYSFNLVHRVSCYRISGSSTPILTVYLGEVKSQYIAQVSVHIRGSVQVGGRVPSPGPKALYTLQTADAHPIDSDSSLSTNVQDSLYPISGSHSYDLFWDRGSDVVRGIKKARRVILWAHARSVICVLKSRFVLNVFIDILVTLPL